MGPGLIPGFLPTSLRAAASSCPASSAVHFRPPPFARGGASRLRVACLGDSPRYSPLRRVLQYIAVMGRPHRRGCCALRRPGFIPGCPLSAPGIDPRPWVPTPLALQAGYGPVAAVAVLCAACLRLPVGSAPLRRFASLGPPSSIRSLGACVWLPSGHSLTPTPGAPWRGQWRPSWPPPPSCFSPSRTAAPAAVGSAGGALEATPVAVPAQGSASA